MAHNLLYHGFLNLVHSVLFCGVDLKSKQRIFGYSHNSGATIAQAGSSYLASGYHSFLSLIFHSYIRSLMDFISQQPLYLLLDL